MSCSRSTYGNLALADHSAVAAEAIYLLPTRSRLRRQVCWERVLLPFVLLGCMWAHQGNVSVSRQLEVDRADAQGAAFGIVR